MGKINSILFVCTGNSCRSVMAEGLARKELARLGKNIKAASAGVRALAGFPPTEETVQVMKESGVDVSGFRSKPLSEDLVKSSDLILVMERMHKNEIEARFPNAAGKVHLVKEYMRSDRGDAPYDELNIPDPIGMSLDYYRNCSKAIKNEIDRIVKSL